MIHCSNVYGNIHYTKISACWLAEIISDNPKQWEVCWNVLLKIIIWLCITRTGNYQFTNVIGWNGYWPRSRFSHLDCLASRSAMFWSEKVAWKSCMVMYNTKIHVSACCLAEIMSDNPKQWRMLKFHVEIKVEIKLDVTINII